MAAAVNAGCHVLFDGTLKALGAQDFRSLQATTKMIANKYSALFGGEGTKNVLALVDKAAMDPPEDDKPSPHPHLNRVYNQGQRRLMASGSCMA
eukprot:107299_1